MATIACVLCGNALSPRQHPQAQFCIPCQPALIRWLRDHPSLMREVRQLAVRGRETSRGHTAGRYPQLKEGSP